jgi:ribosome-binding factor A
MKPYRLERVAEAIREVASQTILFELSDPRVKDVTVTRAEVSADLQHAKVYVSVMGSEKEQELCMHGLRHATGYVQRKVGDRLQIRFTPAIQFVVDKGVKNSIEITRLINEAKAKGGLRTAESEGEGPQADTDAEPAPPDEDRSG